MESAYIDVVIATVFLFVTLSLIVTTITQGVTRLFGLRAHYLMTGLEKLLGFRGDESEAAAEDGGDERDGERSGRTLTERLFDTGFILGAPKKSEHIEPRQFANALLQVHRDDVKRIPSRVRDLLFMLREAAGDDVDAWRQEIEAWFDAAMAEVGAWFRKRTRIITLIVASVVVVGLNADALALIDQAWRDRALRESLVAAAAAAVDESGKEQEAESSPDLTEIRTQVDDALSTFPLGWREGTPFDSRSVLGLLITFVAVNLGAPFWFDVLKRVMKLRAQIQKARE